MGNKLSHFRTLLKYEKMTFSIPKIIRGVKSWEGISVLTVKSGKGTGSTKLKRYPTEISFS